MLKNVNMLKPTLDFILKPLGLTSKGENTSTVSACVVCGRPGCCTLIELVLRNGNFHEIGSCDIDFFAKPDRTTNEKS